MKRRMKQRTDNGYNTKRLVEARGSHRHSGSTDGPAKTAIRMGYKRQQKEFRTRLSARRAQLRPKTIA